MRISNIGSQLVFVFFFTLIAFYPLYSFAEDDVDSDLDNVELFIAGESEEEFNEVVTDDTTWYQYLIVVPIRNTLATASTLFESFMVGESEGELKEFVIDDTTWYQCFVVAPIRGTIAAVVTLLPNRLFGKQSTFIGKSGHSLLTGIGYVGADQFAKNAGYDKESTKNKISSSAVFYSGMELFTGCIKVKGPIYRYIVCVGSGLALRLSDKLVVEIAKEASSKLGYYFPEGVNWVVKKTEPALSFEALAIPREGGKKFLACYFPSFFPADWGNWDNLIQDPISTIPIILFDLAFGEDGDKDKLESESEVGLVSGEDEHKDESENEDKDKYELESEDDAL